MDIDTVKAVEELAPKFINASFIYVGNEEQDLGFTFEFKQNERVDFASWSKVKSFLEFIENEGIRFEEIIPDRNGFISGNWMLYVRVYE